MEQVDTERLEKLLFTTSKPDEKLHRCVVVFNSKYAIMYSHGSHSSFKKYQKLVLYNVTNSTLEIEVIVSVVNENNDFVIFEPIDGEFPEYPHGINSMYAGQKYLQLGINQKRGPVWKEGIISKMCYGYYLGTSHDEYGDSGSGIFNLDGRFIGISLAKKSFAFSNNQISASKIDFEELADHHPYMKIISADAIFSYLIIDDPDFPPPEKKHAAEME